MSSDLSAPLLLLLDGLLSRDNEQIHDALVILNEAVQALAPEVSLLPTLPCLDAVRTRSNGIFNVETKVTTLFSKSRLVQPTITWTQSRTWRVARRRRSRDDEECEGVVKRNTSTSNNINYTEAGAYGLGGGNVVDDDHRGWQYQHCLDLCKLIEISLDVCPTLAYTRSVRDGSIALHFAASLGIVPIVSSIFHKYPDCATIPNVKGKIPLHYAAREGRYEVVDFFLRTVPGIAAIATDKRKLALHFAAGDGHWNVCRMLLSAYPHGASLPSVKGKLPLHLCARWGHTEAAYDLIQCYPDGVRALDWEGGLPLHDAAREGKVEMARYLVELFPMALSTCNMRNEIPLFPAVRSGVLECVALLVQAWPAGSRCILQNISKHDNIKSWMSWSILELLLRGAVQKLYGCSLLDGVEPPKIKLITNDDWKAVVQPPMPPQWELQKPKNKDKPGPGKKFKVLDTRGVEEDERYMTRLLSIEAGPQTGNGAVPDVARDGVDDLDFDFDEVVMTTVMRSKSPTLQEYHLEPTSNSDRKRQARNTIYSSAYSSDSSGSFYVPEHERKFIPLHAALECSASSHVIRFLIDTRLEKDIYEIDERGMLPLHWAVTQCNRPHLDTIEEREMMIDMILNDLLDPALDLSNATTVRDRVYNRLPLHFAILYKADIRVVQALLAANPPSAIEKCLTRDMFHDKTPLHMAAHCNCELDIVYELLRADPAFVSRERR